MTYTYSDEIVSDLYKDARGFRPDSSFHHTWNQATPGQKQAIWDNLSQELQVAEAQQTAREAAAIEQAENAITVILNTVQGSTRADAIRYLHDLHQTNNDEGFLEYLLGVPYGYLKG